MTRKFTAYRSSDDGQTFKKVRSSGWPITLGKDKTAPIDGFVITIDDATDLIDVELSERDLRLIAKDIKKAKELNHKDVEFVSLPDAKK